MYVIMQIYECGILFFESRAIGGAQQSAVQKDEHSNLQWSLCKTAKVYSENLSLVENIHRVFLLDLIYLIDSLGGPTTAPQLVFL